MLRQTGIPNQLRGQSGGLEPPMPCPDRKEIAEDSGIGVVNLTNQRPIMG